MSENIPQIRHSEGSNMSVEKIRDRVRELGNKKKEQLLTATKLSVLSTITVAAGMSVLKDAQINGGVIWESLAGGTLELVGVMALAFGVRQLGRALDTHFDRKIAENVLNLNKLRHKVKKVNPNV